MSWAAFAVRACAAARRILDRAKGRPPLACEVGPHASARPVPGCLARGWPAAAKNSSSVVHPISTRARAAASSASTAAVRLRVHLAHRGKRLGRRSSGASGARPLLQRGNGRREAAALSRMEGRPHSSSPNESALGDGARFSQRSSSRAADTACSAEARSPGSVGAPVRLESPGRPPAPRDDPQARWISTFLSLA